MRKGARGLVNSLSSGNPKKITDALDRIPPANKMSPDDLRDILKAIVGVIKIGDPSLSKRALDVLIRLSNENPAVVTAIAPAMLKYLEILLSSAARDDPDAYLGRIAKVVVILGTGVKTNPALVPSVVPMLSAILSAPIYRPDRDRNWQKLYSAVIRILAMAAASNPSSVSSAVQPVLKCFNDTFKYTALAENARSPDGIRWQCLIFIKELERHYPEVLVPYLVKASTDENREFKQSVVNILMELGKDPSVVVPTLKNAMLTPVKEIAENAGKVMIILAKTHPDRMAEYVADMFKSGNKTHTVVGLKLIGIVCANDPNQVGRFEDTIKKHLLSKDKEIRRHTLEALKEAASSHPEAVEQLIPFVINSMTDREEAVRLAAIAVLDAVAGKRPDLLEIAIPGLIERLRDGREHVVWRVRDVLSKMDVDPVEYPRSWRMVDKARKSLAPLKRDGRATEEMLSLEKRAMEQLVARDYDGAFTTARQLIEIISLTGGGGGAEEASETGEEEPGEPPVAAISEPPSRTTRDGRPIFSNYGEDEEIPVTGRAAELLETVGPSASSTQEPMLTEDDPIQDLLAKFRREMEAIKLDSNDNEEEEIAEDDSGAPAPEAQSTTDAPQNSDDAGVGQKRMFCHYCGARIPPDSIFCNKCGRKLI